MKKSTNPSSLSLHPKAHVQGIGLGNQALRRVMALAWIGFLFLTLPAKAQNEGGTGTVSGDLELFQNVFFLDSTILSDPIPPQYYQQLSSTDGWMNLNYRQGSLAAGIRFDLFLNSGLRNPYVVRNQQGIGFWYISHQVQRLTLRVGNFYEQFGNGITFRAYEGRGQNLDYAMFGLSGQFKINDQWQIKGFTGKQKVLFDTYAPVIKGLCLQGSMKSERLGLNYAPGFSMVNRTLDANSMQNVVGSIENLEPSKRFVPKYNAYVGSFFQNVQWGGWDLNTEWAFKSREAVLDRNGILENSSGLVLYTDLGYSTDGFGINIQHKHTDHFDFRVSPLEILNEGLINYIPPGARMNTYRLTSRYAPATQLVGEDALQIETVFSPSRKTQIQVNASHVQGPDRELYYQEWYAEAKHKFNKQITLSGGLQRVIYNQQLYEFKPGAPLVKTWTPFAELTYKINRRESLRIECSQMSTDQDLGDWLWGLVEYNIAPRYSFSIMDMWNYGNKNPDKRNHYYTAFAALNWPGLRLTGGYVRQVQGIICTGGVCRVEPAFNGLRFSLSANF